MLRLSCILVFLVSCQHAIADVLVRMEVQQDTVTSNVDLKLFEDETPLTVANFLNYVNDGDYVDSFIHRSVDNFVIQGGGFTFDPNVGDGTFSYDSVNDVYNGGLDEVPTDPPVPNEFNRSNLRGTIAMAKLGGDPDSATSQWFINLTDNSAILDGQNGGFTVFGEVLASGMTIVDQIAAQARFDKTDIHPAFGELPLINYTDPDPVNNPTPIVQDNLVRVNAMTQLLSISADIDFGPLLINTSTQTDITIRNIDTVPHSIGDIGTTDTVDLPFTVVLPNVCANTTLNPTEACMVTIQFSPQTENVFNDTFNIELADLGLSYSFALTGEGVLTPPAPDIAPSLDTIAFGESQLFDPLLGFPDQIVLFVNNDGNLDLNLTSVSLGGADATDFEIVDNCTVTSPVAPAAFCTIPINFKPLTVGDKSATLTLTSNDPDESVLVLPITGIASLDTDGIPIAVEDGAYNDGDGNNDGILDSAQNHVASFPALNNTYLTLLVTPGATINDITVLTEDQVVAPPDNVRFNLGILDFTIENLPPGAVVEVGIVLPPGYIPSTYYMYGPTPDDINPHWYEFMFDGTTGAVLLGEAVITAPDGTTMQRQLIRLIFQDGERGDADLTANGVIVDPGAPVAGIPEADSGAMSLLLLLVLPGLVLLIRSRQGA